MGVNCCEEYGFDEVTPCDLSNDDLVVVTSEDEAEHAEVSKDCKDCSIDKNQMSTNELRPKPLQMRKEVFERSLLVFSLTFSPLDHFARELGASQAVNDILYHDVRANFD